MLTKLYFIHMHQYGLMSLVGKMKAKLLLISLTANSNDIAMGYVICCM